MPRARQALVILATLLISSQASLVLAEEEEQTICSVLVDWDVEELHAPWRKDFLAFLTRRLPAPPEGTQAPYHPWR